MNRNSPQVPSVWCWPATSHDYSEDDYIRNVDDYLKYLAQA